MAPQEQPWAAGFTLRLWVELCKEWGSALKVPSGCDKFRGSVGTCKGLVPSLAALREPLLAWDGQCLCFDEMSGIAVCFLQGAFWNRHALLTVPIILCIALHITLFLKGTRWSSGQTPSWSFRELGRIEKG